MTYSPHDKSISMVQLEWLGEEVKRQKAPADKVAPMAAGMLYMQGIPWKEGFDVKQFTTQDVFRVNALVQNRGVILSADNIIRYRSTPVVFINGGASCHHQSVPYAMERLLEHIPDVFESDMYIHKTSIEAWIKQFLWIHPFEDGNCRTASILMNWMFPDGLNKPFPLWEFEF